MKIIYIITHKDFPKHSMIVEHLSDFMFAEGWRVDKELPYKSQRDDEELRESEDYFRDLQYSRDDAWINTLHTFDSP